MKTPTKTYEEEFDERFPQFGDYPEAFEIPEPNRLKIKSFHHQKVQEVVRELEKTEGEYEYVENDQLCNEREELMDSQYETMGEAESGGYNQALTDAIKIIKRLL